MPTYVGQLKKENKSLRQTSGPWRLQGAQATTVEKNSGIAKNVLHHGQFNGTTIETEKLCGCLIIDRSRACSATKKSWTNCQGDLLKAVG